MHTASSQTDGPARAEDEIPEAPPPALRERYLRLSRAYVYWCVGMLVWTLLCVGYFIVTSQALEMAIGTCLGLLLLALILSPATLFGGKTWHKRLAWVTILTGLFSAMFAYPLIVVAMGVWRRIEEGRYSTWPSFNDVWHAALSLLTVVMAAWTVWVTVRAAKLVRRLQRGDYEGV